MFHLSLTHPLTYPTGTVGYVNGCLGYLPIPIRSDDWWRFWSTYTHPTGWRMGGSVHLYPSGRIWYKTHPSGWVLTKVTYQDFFGYWLIWLCSFWTWVSRFDNQTDIFIDLCFIIKPFDNQSFWDIWLIIFWQMTPRGYTTTYTHPTGWRMGGSRHRWGVWLTSSVDPSG